MKTRFVILLTVSILFTLKAKSQVAEPLKLIQTISLPGLHDGDFDHLATSLSDHLLFLAAEENS
jgi:hypothetical protein